MPPGGPSHQPRRPNDYHYSPSPHYAYPTYHHQPQYYAPPPPPPQHHYPQQWYQPHQHYQSPMPRPYIPQQPQQPLVVSSYPHAPPAMPQMNRQPTYPPPPSRTPQPEQSTSSIASQPVISSATTPSNLSVTTSTPPPKKETPVVAVSLPSAPVVAPAPLQPQSAQRMPFYPQVSAINIFVRILLTGIAPVAFRSRGKLPAQIYATATEEKGHGASIKHTCHASTRRHSRN